MERKDYKTPAMECVESIKCDVILASNGDNDGKYKAEEWGNLS